MSGPTGLDPGTFTLRSTDTYAIDVVADAPATATIEELREMLQTILAERFNLRTHRETRAIQGYALVVAKGGPKVKEVQSGDEPPRATYDEALRRSIKGTSKLKDLVDVLLPSVFAPIVDKTGLNGVYQYEFFAPLPPPPAPAGPARDAQTAPAAPAQTSISSLAATLEEQLGLRLQPDSVSIEMIVIDQLERLSPN
jgi:uncharacterized protein (TIGR03435 family)